jgi:hypothetical protein
LENGKEEKREKASLTGGIKPTDHGSGVLFTNRHFTLLHLLLDKGGVL